MILGISKLTLSLRHINSHFLLVVVFALTTPQRTLSLNKSTSTNKKGTSFLKLYFIVLLIVLLEHKNSSMISVPYGANALMLPCSIIYVTPTVSSVKVGVAAPLSNAHT